MLYRKLQIALIKPDPTGKIFILNRKFFDALSYLIYIDVAPAAGAVVNNLDPDIFALWQKSYNNNFKIIRDDICESKIKNYICRCSEIDLKVKKIIKEKLSNKNKVIVWGVGTHTQRLIDSGLELSKILFFVDSNTKYSGKKINGVEIKSPAEIKEDTPILISTYSYQEEVVYQIKEILKLDNEVIKIY